MKIQLNRQKKGFTLIELMVVIAILASLAAVGYGPIMEHMNDGDRQQASSNLGQLQKMLFTFRQENGQYPCDATAENLRTEHADLDFGELTGAKSNAYLRQLFYGSSTSETTFFAKHAGTREPDGRIANGQCLARGENAFAYVLRKESNNDEDAPGLRSVADTPSGVPLAFSCVPSTANPIPGDKLYFNRDLFYAHAFMVRIDGSTVDLKDKLTEDAEDESRSVFTDNYSPFPESRRGNATAPNYVVVTPEL